MGRTPLNRLRRRFGPLRVAPSAAAWRFAPPPRGATRPTRCARSHLEHTRMKMPALWATAVEGSGTGYDLEYDAQR